MFIKHFIRSLSVLFFCFIAVAAHALTIVDYSPAAIQKAEAAGRSYVLAFHADWCPTCRAQAKAFEQLKSDPALKKVTIFVVDYDGENELKKSLKVRTQSTLITYKGKKETMRNTGETSVNGLKEILVKSL
jgi:thioredoxin 1